MKKVNNNSYLYETFYRAVKSFYERQQNSFYEVGNLLKLAFVMKAEGDLIIEDELKYEISQKY